MGRDFPPQTIYSRKCADETYEYRHVTLAQSAFEKAWRLTCCGKQLLSEAQWRNVGVQQGRGWEHYEIYAREPQILLFRRLLGTITGGDPTIPIVQEEEPLEKSEEEGEREVREEESYDIREPEITLTTSPVVGWDRSPQEFSEGGERNAIEEDAREEGKTREAQSYLIRDPVASSPVPRCTIGNVLLYREQDVRYRIIGKKSVQSSAAASPIRRELISRDKKAKEETEKKLEKKPRKARKAHNKGKAEKGSYDEKGTYVRASRIRADRSHPQNKGHAVKGSYDEQGRYVRPSRAQAVGKGSYDAGGRCVRPSRARAARARLMETDGS